LAAAYAFGLAKNHPFVDGNKRIALASIFAFLFRNGYIFNPTEAAAVDAILDLVTGTVGEEQLADWIEDNSKPR
jgi:death-on-curing protein